MKPTLALVFFAALFVAGCMTPAKQNAIMESWKGRNVHELLVVWGRPTQSKPDGSGGRVLVFDASVTSVMPGPSTSPMTPGVNQYQNSYDDLTQFAPVGYEPSSTITLKRTRTFWVDANGTIYRWAWDRI